MFAGFSFATFIGIDSTVCTLSMSMYPHDLFWVGTIGTEYFINLLHDSKTRNSSSCKSLDSGWQYGLCESANLFTE
jgi:hypothetical protein